MGVSVNPHMSTKYTHICVGFFQEVKRLNHINFTKLADAQIIL